MGIQKNVFVRLFRCFPLRRKEILIASLYSILNKICDIIPEIMIGIAIDVVVNSSHSLIAKLGIIDPYHQLYFISGCTALLWILESVFEYMYSVAWHDIAQDMQHELRLKTYQVIQILDMQWFEDKTVGSLLHTLYDDINQLEQFFSQGPNDIIQLVVNIILMGSIFLYLSPMLALFSLIPIPFIIFIAHYFQYKLARIYEVVRQTSNDLSSYIAYRLQGIMTIKSYVTEAYELERLKKESNFYKHAKCSANRMNAIYLPMIIMAIMVGFITSLLVGGIYSLQGKIPIHWYATLVFLTQRFLWPFASLSSITDMYEKSVASANRLLNIIEYLPPAAKDMKAFDLSLVQGKINFDDVSFTYVDGMQVFDSISFEIPAHTTVAFVGETGSGKSTIVKLLLRLYEQNAGLISIDNQNIENIELSTLRRSMALVSQDIYLVEGTIADNIRYGTFDASYEQVIEAAKMAQIHDFIMKLPLNYHTMLQECGKNMSGGQRQRIAIARAILKQAPILIFDEATSALDNETEAAIQQSIITLRLKHTVIIIAHSLSMVRTADTIIVLKEGIIVEKGAHEELLRIPSGVYAHLWHVQHD